jgi:predicted Zn-dependent protease
MFTFHRCLLLSLIGAMLLSLSGCYTVPVTGRSSFMLVGSEEEMSLGLQAFSEVRKSTPVSSDTAVNNRVRRVGDTIARVSAYPDWNWEFVVFDDPTTVNAWCLPGGKVGVYTGLLPYTRTDAELATVMAHEIGHAVARHGAERMSQEMVLATGESVVVGSVADKNTEIAKVAYGVGSQLFVSLPYSRKMEYEADRIGLMYMARAGYDPREAVTFWQRFAEANKGGKPPEWLSTHPADDKRVEQIKLLLPDAIKEYEQQHGKAAN